LTRILCWRCATRDVLTVSKSFVPAAAERPPWPQN